MYPIADIIEPRVRAQLIKDGYGYCVYGLTKSFIRVQVVPDSEFYIHARNATREEARAWYESFDVLKAYERLVKLLDSL